MSEILLTSYGDSKGQKKGIFALDTDYGKAELRIPLNGKCNAVTRDGNQTIYCEDRSGIYYLVFSENGSVVKEIETKYFYNYLNVTEDKILLASFSHGVDAVYDKKTGKITKEVIHERKGQDGFGRSHYIRQLKDGWVISVENKFNQIYVYADDGLKIDHIEEFDEKNIRLMSFADEEKTVFLNTEVSNELLVLDGTDFSLKETWKLTENQDSFSGGHTIDDQGRFVFVGIRGEDQIAVYKNQSGNVSFIEKIECGKMPRDMMYENGLLYVSCTNENAVEVYQMKDDHLVLVNRIEINNPITFEMR